MSVKDMTSKMEALKAVVSKHQGHLATDMSIELSPHSAGRWWCYDCQERICSVDEMEALRKYLGKS